MSERPKSSQGPVAAEQAAKEPIVFIIDDDLSVRRALTNLFESVGLHVEAFGSAPEMLQNKLPDVASCLVLDIRLPGLSGLDLQTELACSFLYVRQLGLSGRKCRIGKKADPCRVGY